MWAQRLQSPPQPHFCGLLQSLGRAAAECRGHGERIRRAESCSSPIRCLKDRICAHKASPFSEASRLHSGGVGGHRERVQPPEGLEEGLQKQLPGIWALSQSFAGRPANKLCDPDPEQLTHLSGLSSHLSRQWAGSPVPPQSITKTVNSTPQCLCLPLLHHYHGLGLDHHLPPPFLPPHPSPSPLGSQREFKKRQFRSCHLPAGTLSRARWTLHPSSYRCLPFLPLQA